MEQKNINKSLLAFSSKIQKNLIWLPMENNKYPKRVKVTAYSGYKLNERPVSFSMDDRHLEVKQIIETWRDPDHDVFKIKADDGKEYILKWNVVSDQWFLE